MPRKKKVTVIDGPLTKRQVPLEEIIAKSQAIIEFPRATVLSIPLLRTLEHQEVYIEEIGSDQLLHGKIKNTFKHSKPLYDFYYKDSNLSKPELHSYSDLKRIYVL